MRSHKREVACTTEARGLKKTGCSEGKLIEGVCPLPVVL